jgi:hypothetical protein
MYVIYVYCDHYGSGTVSAAPASESIQKFRSHNTSYDLTVVVINQVR